MDYICICVNADGVIVAGDVNGLLEFNISLWTYRDHASPRNESLYCPDQDLIPVSQDTMIDEQSSASGHDYASDHSAIRAGAGDVNK